MRDTEYKPPKITIKITVPGLFFGRSNKELAKENQALLQIVLFFFYEIALNQSKIEIRERNYEKNCRERYVSSRGNRSFS